MAAAILGGLDAAKKAPNTDIIKQNQPILESLKLNTVPLKTLPPNMIIPPTNVYMPYRTVIPEKYNYNFSQNKFKG